MLRKLVLLSTLVCAIPVFCEPSGAAKYQIATVVAVGPHSSAAQPDSTAPSYDISLQVGNTVYVVLYTPRLDLQTVKYAAGRQVLVSVGKDSVTYNDISGNSFKLPILSRKAVAGASGK
jgi:hypothetical protein